MTEQAPSHRLSPTADRERKPSRGRAGALAAPTSPPPRRQDRSPARSAARRHYRTRQPHRDRPPARLRDRRKNQYGTMSGTRPPCATRRHEAGETDGAQRDLYQAHADDRSVSESCQEGTSLRSAPQGAMCDLAAPSRRASPRAARGRAPRAPGERPTRADAKTNHPTDRRLCSKALGPAARTIIRCLTSRTFNGIARTRPRIKTGRRGLAYIASWIGAQVAMRHGVASQA